MRPNAARPPFRTSVASFCVNEPSVARRIQQNWNIGENREQSSIFPSFLPPFGRLGRILNSEYIEGDIIQQFIIRSMLLEFCEKKREQLRNEGDERKVKLR